ncbi:LacI family DNA-binding transcriptional regulator [Aquimarina sp. W85]|uniref:LacI family DNA-binding transcriptional regulator n=1 Tax=Aquimarina rhodophyticola TaxID=3342246 RepID=UPI0036715181
MRKKVTLKQLAKELNLSISTVSKSLKDDKEISQKTIARVKELAAFYNFKPNALAVGLKSKKTNTIGVILPDILNHFFAKVLHGIETEAAKKGYKILTCISNESYQKEVDYIEMLSNNSVDGLIVSLSQETQIGNQLAHIRELKRDNIPVVLFDRVSDMIDCDKVIIDDAKAAANAMQYLIDSGCKRICIITTIFNLSVGALRCKGAKEIAEQYDDVLCHILTIDDSNQIELMIESFLQSNEIDAILGLDETAAAVSVNIAAKMNLKIPEQLSVIGFTDGLLAKYSYPKLSIVSQHAEKLGIIATQTLLDRLSMDLSKNTRSITKVVDTTLVLRDSTLSKRD